MTALRDRTAALLQVVDDVLGDEIVYTPSGGAATALLAWVVFNTEHVTSPGSAATAYPKSVEVRFDQIRQPTKADRITIALRPGEVYAPSDIIEDDTGEAWILPLKRVAT